MTLREQIEQLPPLRMHFADGPQEFVRRADVLALLPAAPEADAGRRETCATCRHKPPRGRFFSCLAGVSTDENCAPSPTFGCNLHEPLPSAETD